MKNILITGGAGFIGSKLSLSLLGKGYNVTVLDNLSEQIHGKAETSFLFNSIKNKVRFIKGDVRSPEDWLNALENQSIVVHLAAETGTGQSMYAIEKYIDVNVRGTSVFLDILVNNKIKLDKIVLASSRAIYGEGKYQCPVHSYIYPSLRNLSSLTKGKFDLECKQCNNILEACPTDENSMIHPTSIYGISKQVQEELIMMIGASLGIPSISLRYQNVFGPGQSLSNPYTGILSIFSNRLLNNKDVLIFEDGKESRDFIFIDDVINATILCIENNSVKYEIFNVGSGKNVSVEKVAIMLKDKLKSKSNLIKDGTFRLGDIRHNFADITKIRKKLSFEPKYSFEDGLNIFVDWVKKQQLSVDYYEKSLMELRLRGLLTN